MELITWLVLYLICFGISFVITYRVTNDPMNFEYGNSDRMFAYIFCCGFCFIFLPLCFIGLVVVNFKRRYFK